MKKPVFKLNTGGNYIRLGSTHIFVRVGKKELDIIENCIAPSCMAKYHFFVGDIDHLYGIEEAIKLLSELGRSNKHGIFIIHVPKAVKDILADEDLSDVLNINKKFPSAYRISIITEKCGPIFNIPNSDHLLQIVYGIDRITATVVFGRTDLMRHYDDQIIENEMQEKYPEKFKDKIIANFKKVTPFGILKSFKNEKDIWDYLKCQGDWKERSVKGLRAMREDPNSNINKSVEKGERGDGIKQILEPGYKKH